MLRNSKSIKFVTLMKAQITSDQFDDIMASLELQLTQFKKNKMKLLKT